MYNHKGSTLIESLFAFQIFVCVLVAFIGLYTSLNKQDALLIQKYGSLLQKEEDVISLEEFQNIINEVLH